MSFFYNNVKHLSQYSCLIQTPLFEKVQIPLIKGSNSAICKGPTPSIIGQSRSNNKSSIIIFFISFSVVIPLKRKKVL